MSGCKNPSTEATAPASVVKGNRPLRFFAFMMLLMLSLAHFFEQINLFQISFLWVIVAMALNAIQASYTGFCPMFKNARGECVACGVVCDPAAVKDSACESSSHSPSDEKGTCCDSSVGCGCSATNQKQKP